MSRVRRPLLLAALEAARHHTSVHPEKDYQQRLESYGGLRHLNGISVEQLSEAGFFFEAPYTLTCYFCGGQNRYNPKILADADYNAWALHSRYFPTCYNLIMRKGINFIARYAKLPYHEIMDILEIIRHRHHL